MGTGTEKGTEMQGKLLFAEQEAKRLIYRYETDYEQFLFCAGQAFWRSILTMENHARSVEQQSIRSLRN